MSPAPVPIPAAAASGCCSVRPESPHELRRRHVLHAAEACFARSGFHGASMQEICGEAQMSPGALYRYFRSKDEIIAAIADEDRLRNAALLAELRGDGDLCERLVTVAMAHLVAMRRPGAAALMAEVMAESLRNTTIGEKFLRNEMEVRSAIRQVLVDLAEAGRIDPVGSIDLVMGFLCAVVDGLVMRMAFEAELTPDAVEPMLRTVVASVLRPTAAEVGLHDPIIEVREAAE